MMQANRVITIRSEAGNSMPAKISIQGRRKLTRRNNFLVKLKCPPAMTNFRVDGQVRLAFLFQAACSSWTEQIKAAQQADMATAIKLQVAGEDSDCELRLFR